LENNSFILNEDPQLKSIDRCLLQLQESEIGHLFLMQFSLISMTVLSFFVQALLLMGIVFI